MHAEPSVVLAVAVIVASVLSLAGWSGGHSDKKKLEEKKIITDVSLFYYVIMT